MICRKINLGFDVIIYLLIIAINFSVVKAQSYRLVWSDEFNGSLLDQSIWSFELGQFNDCVHYSTDRPANTRLTDGKLQLIALKESYQGYDYTASVIKTKHALYWRYGRIEASIKLPGSNGFVPAFWLLPEDERYGWWPSSGEIDIMEYPTNEISKIYGTIHSGAYNAFTGSGSRGDTIVIPDIESAFHLYAIEWTPDKIGFFVDDDKYYTFNNDNSGFQTWPFDHPFYIILNMAVGGGWVGNPTASTVFPAIMEVDYIRVYQNFEDFAIYGPDYVMPNDKSLSYSSPVIDGTQYKWSVPNTAQIISGQNTRQINVNWGSFTGTIELLLTTIDGSRLIKYPVEMSNNLLKNADFEKGSKYWNIAGYFPAGADFFISTQDVQSGDRSIFVDAKSPGVNAWDIQLSQTNLALESGQSYYATFWAKSETNSAITAAIINASTFNLYTSYTFQLTNTWMKYNFTFIAPANETGSFNIDMGGHTGQYHFDDFKLNIPAPATDNQVKNADFSAGDSAWIFNTFYPAIAKGSVKDGEYAVSITNGGENAWDIHVGQAGFNIEKGEQYTVSFDAYAAAPREILPLVGKNSDPWTVYNDYETVLLSTNRENYTFSFIMNKATDSEARLGFDIGLSSDDVFFDNVFLRKGSWPGTVIKQISSSPRSILLFQNFPNPFNPLTTIEFELSETCIVSLKIYNVHGKLVKTLLENDTVAGVHQLQWNGSECASGVYCCQLSVNGMSQVNKLILIK
jgi:beta-glucanase (GH16 family)